MRDKGEAVADAAGFVLAGGRSSRMGTDKAMVQFRGEPLVVHALRILKEAGLSASIAGARASLERFAPVVQDRESDRGPLGGICSALASSDCRYAVFIPVDLPLMPGLLLSHLLDAARRAGAAVTLSSLRGFAQTFPVVLDRAILPHLRTEFEAGRGGCFTAFQSVAGAAGQAPLILAAESIVLADSSGNSHSPPPEVWFLNLNSPAELETAEAYSAQNRVS